MSTLFATYDDTHDITFEANNAKQEFKSFSAHYQNKSLTLKLVRQISEDDQTIYQLKSPKTLPLDEVVKIKANEEEVTLHIGKVVRTEWFDETTYYEGDDLGAKYAPNHTNFKLWTPVAHNVSLLLFDNDHKMTSQTMKRLERGVWHVKVLGDFDETRYQFETTINGKTQRLIDPYGVASTANATHSVVVDPKKFVKMRAPKPPFSGTLTDAIIYEANIRDLTNDPSIRAKYPSTFKGAMEKSLKTPSGNQAGFDYIRSLGVTHIQWMPVFDFAGVDEHHPFDKYNWGYNPVQYNVPEGSYSTNPDSPYQRINELRSMVDAYHKAGLRIVFDVVFNHVFNTSTFPFNRMVPGYAYRVDDQGILTNASGCDSDLATERKMIRKFIVDSLKYWLKTYGADGFRFDLMGLIDLDTMNAIHHMINKTHHDCIVYGEGWQMKSSLEAKKLTHMYNDLVPKTIGFFNDRFRDTIKGGTFSPKALGYVSGARVPPDMMLDLLTGSVRDSSIPKSPMHSINYVACHDNHALYDKLYFALKHATPEVRRASQNLATAITLLAQGVPFLHMGQEFFRTKQGIGNSYKSPDDINRINWSLIDDYQPNIALIKTLITLRKNLVDLKYYQADKIIENTHVSMSDQGTCLYEIYGKTHHIIIVFKPTLKEEHLTFTEPFDIVFNSECALNTTTQTIKLCTIGTTILTKLR